MTKNILALLAVISFTANINAADTKKETTNKTSSDIQNLMKEKKTEDIDTEITNARMRAETGGKDKFSFSTSMNYAGGRIDNAFGADRPVLTGDPTNKPPTSLSAVVGARYRLSKRQTLSLGTSLALNRPFDQTRKLSLSNPALTYEVSYATGAVQNSTYVSVDYGTSETSISRNYFGGWGMGHTALTDFDGSMITFGVSTGLGGSIYRDAPQKGDQRGEISLGVYPFTEIKLTDKMNIRTVWGFFNYYKPYSTDKFTKTPNYLSTGLGTSVSRDLYLYPYFQVNPNDIQFKKSRVGLSAIINLNI